jgi:hypothetical protein
VTYFVSEGEPLPVMGPRCVNPNLRPRPKLLKIKAEAIYIQRKSLLTDLSQATCHREHVDRRVKAATEREAVSKALFPSL